MNLRHQRENTVTANRPHRAQPTDTQRDDPLSSAAGNASNAVTPADSTVWPSNGYAVTDTCATPLTTSHLQAGSDSTAPKRVSSRGLSAVIPTTVLQRLIWTRALLLVNRFRVVRTVDIAVTCFAERPFKAALTAAQRAVRGLVKADLLRRYRTERYQTVYGLTQRGVDWLAEFDHEAASSVRRVSDMSNPEHRLWAQFLVLSAEARGLKALTEQELLIELNRGNQGNNVVQGLLKVTVQEGTRSTVQQLRPDAVSREVGVDGQVQTSWYEVDRSKRGSSREAALAALAMRVGSTLVDGSKLQNLVVFARTDRIEKRALAVLRNLAAAQNGTILVDGRRHLVEISPGTFEVTAAVDTLLGDSRTVYKDRVVGHVIVQRLPVWLPKARLAAGEVVPLPGWFSENYLPYRRPHGEWPPARVDWDTHQNS